MIFFLNLDGTCTRQDTDHVYQGSNNVSKVIAVTSISPAQTFVQVAFTLPNSLTYGYLPMAYKGAYQVGNDVNNLMHLWEFSLPYNVTEMKGTVGVSFNVVNSNTGANSTSYTSTFTVEYSALPPPSSASESELEQILNLLNAYYAQNTGIIADHTSQIQAIQTEQTTQNNAISTLQAQSTNLQQAVTKNASDIAEIKTEQTAQNSAISDLQSYVLTGENYVGTLPSSATMPTDEQIQQYYAQNVGRSPRVSDVLFFTLTVTSEYKVFKYIYTVTGWAYYEIPGANVGSNPNMIINPDSAINQRGITTLLNGIGFMSDHWYKIAGGNYVQIDIEDGVYTITTKNNYTETTRVLGQIIENGIALRGKTVTFSVNVLNAYSDYYFLQIHVLNAQKTVIANSAGVSLNSAQIKSVTYTVPDNAVYVQANIVVNLATAPINSFIRFKEPKLEIGEVPTLYSPPNPAEELAKCQRYYFDVCYNLRDSTIPYLIGTGVCSTNTFAHILVPLPTTMRTNAVSVTVLKDVTKLTVMTSGNQVAITELLQVGFNDVGITLRATGQFTAGQVAALRVASNSNSLGYLAVDAEI